MYAAPAIRNEDVSCPSAFEFLKSMSGPLREDEEEIKRLLKVGVDGLMTDQPCILKRVSRPAANGCLYETSALERQWARGFDRDGRPADQIALLL
jgi:hypothetical protein